MNGKLTVIPTPIGNLADITQRTIETLSNVDLLLCEDSRVTGKLLKHFNIRAALKPYHAHNEHKTTDAIIEILKAGNHVGIVSDAGMPGLSDPGYLMIRAAIEYNIPVEVLPGANAMLTALISSGFPSDRFHFEGFLPHKKGRNTRWNYLKSVPHTIVIYESPHRILKCLKEVVEHLGAERKIAVCRELTKLHEEIIRGTATDVAYLIEERGGLKGEIVLVVSSE